MVELAGPGVDGGRPGDLVVLMWRPRCGQCEFCATGRPALCPAIKVPVTTGGLLDGTSRLTLADGRPARHFLGVSCFADYCVVGQESVIKIPPQTPPHIAAVAGCAVVTGVGAVLSAMGSGQGAGSGVLVIGAGGVGLSVVMGAALTGAYPIVVADLSQDRLDLARHLGATHVITGAADLPEAVRQAVPGGVQWAFEAVGRPETLLAGMRSLRPTGTLVAIGLSRAGETVSLPINELVQKDIRVVGSLYGSANTGVLIPRLLELYQAGRLPLDALIGARYTLEDINDAYARLPAGSVGRGVIMMGGDC
jgi:S-(hydroxymethyl)glutathione dehydrogenase/alcohol dehydrogenase